MEAAATDSPKTAIGPGSPELPSTRSPLAQNLVPNGPPDGAETITFGMHKGKTFEHMAQKEPGYCSWILKTSKQQSSTCNGFLRLAQYLQIVGHQQPQLAAHVGGHQQPQQAIPLGGHQQQAIPLGGQEQPLQAFPFVQHAGPQRLWGSSVASPAPSPVSRKRSRESAFPTQTLGTSHFLNLYKEAPSRPTVRDCMRAIRDCGYLERVHRDLAKLKSRDSTELRNYAVKLWACLRGCDKKHGGEHFYKLLNNAVIQDDATSLRAMMPLARLLNAVLVKYAAPTDVISYRGSSMTTEQYQDIQVGCTYRVAMFVASSVDRGVAERFVVFEPGRIMVELWIPRRCHNAGYLGVEFWKENEREFLMPPYTVVEAVKKDVAGPYRRLVVRVAYDNKEHDVDMPSILL